MAGAEEEETFYVGVELENGIMKIHAKINGDGEEETFVLPKWN